MTVARIRSKQQRRRHAGAEISRDEFDTLLAWFDPDRIRAAEKYENTRAKVVWMLERNGCPSAHSDELADVTLSIAGRWLGRGRTIESGGFFGGVARKVLSEHRKRLNRSVFLESVREPEVLDDPTDSLSRDEQDGYLAAAMLQLNSDERQLLVAYENARSSRGGSVAFARQRDKSVGALYIEVHRVRLKLRQLLLKRMAVAMKGKAGPSHSPDEGTRE